jgi:transcriptional antiterminator RfaH
MDFSMTFGSDNEASTAELTLVSAKSRWFVVYTRPALEAVALQNLQQQGFDAYLPLYKRLKKTDAGMAAAFEPMFPRYVFFRPSQASQSIAPARSTRGVANIVSFGHEAATIGAHVLRAIRQFEQERNAADEAELSSLRPGHVVRFCHPAFNGLEGLVKSVSSRRVAVLLHLMGRQQIVYVDHQQLKAA